ncbi:MSMEG_0570 family nitrogen starvation response protein [Paraglaciecola sp. L3A3]|uniref:MSMEG_0570 family nitrogen starvation response protein n=1 Tax=Paraglaciecola sp. L3A3 TaxID=2686358 RepID=UPI00131AF36C|nr:MSMEG_0570 family nitrogen starvation response protein [Paraglaciecola sp. L3A3]
MPAVNFTVNWPDGEIVEYYSPSTIIHNFLEKGIEYDLDIFKQEVDKALTAASERVKASFGFYCSAASGEQSKIQNKYTQLINTHKDGKVSVTSFKQ